MKKSRISNKDIMAIKKCTKISLISPKCFFNVRNCVWFFELRVDQDIQTLEITKVHAIFNSVYVRKANDSVWKEVKIFRISLN